MYQSKFKKLFVINICMALSISAYAERNPKLPEPYATVSVLKQSSVIGWAKDQTPTAAKGFQVEEFTALEKPRSMLVLPSGNVLVAQSAKSPADSGENSPNRISLLKIKDGNLLSVSVFAKDLNLPFGIAIWKDQFFVAEPDRVLVFSYKDETITGAGKVIATLPFPKPQRHWTRHLLIKPDGSKLYVSVGSASNVGEDADPLDPRSAAVLEMNLDGSQQKIYAGGVRNPVSMAWEPTTKVLWTVVNERDELGDDLVPDYITPLHDGDYYGWPYAYWGKNADPRLNGAYPELVQKSLTPYYSVGAHTAALGIEFTKGTNVPAPFNNGALITKHGSWNRSKFAGYNVTYVRFNDGKPVGVEIDFLTGFIHDEASSQVYGRPVASIVLQDGSVLVSDDGGGKIWRVTHTPAKNK